MRKLSKKLLALMLVLVCAFSLVACSGDSEATAESGLDSTTEASIVAQVESIVSTLSQMDADAIATYKESSDDFTVSAVTAYEDVYEELGAYQSMGDVTVTVDEDNDEITATGIATFENNTATVTLLITLSDYSMKSLTIDINYTLGQNMQRAGLNTVMGVGIVFIVLIFLTFLISLFKYVGVLEKKMTKKEEAPKKAAPAPAPAAVPAAEEEEEVDDLELIAVIAAAIAASENTSTDSFVVRSIKKVNKTKWRNA